MVTLHTVDGGIVNAINDALLYDFIIGQNGIATGATVTSEGALLLHIDSGWGVIKGRIFSIEAETVSATPSTSGMVKGRLILQIDITNTTDPITFVTQAAATLPALQQEDINNAGTIFQLPIATYDVNEVAVSNLQMVAPIVEAVKKADLAINDENGNNIAKTYASKESITYKKIWTNPNQHVSFAEQSISLDLTNYSNIVVVFYNRASWVNEPIAIVVTRVKNAYTIANMDISSSNNPTTFLIRRFIAKDKNIYFQNAYSHGVSSRNATYYSEDNTWLIPIEIYVK